MEPLREYLAWQAELGGDEVMLASPILKRAPGPMTGSPSAPSAGIRTEVQAPLSTTRPIQGAGDLNPIRATVPETQAETSLFSMLSKSLEVSQDAAKAARRIPIPDLAAAGPGIAADTSGAAPGRRLETSLPAFGNLGACREYLEKNCRTLFTGDVQGLAWRIVHGSGPESAPLAVVGLEASDADGLAGQPFQGSSGALLEKMMRAIRLDLGSLYRTLVVKQAGPGAGRRCYTRRDLVKLLPLFHAELELAKAPVVLLLGEACAQAVLKTGRGLEELRLSPHRLEGVAGREFAVTYHPDDLEGNEDLKRKAWKDLQWLQARLQGS